AFILKKIPAAPICMLDIPRIGGATYYSLRRMEDYLACDRSVLRLTCGPEGHLNATLHYRDISASFSLEGIQALEALPPFHALLVNELAGWTLPQALRQTYQPVGEGRPRWIPALTAFISRLAANWQTRLEYVVHDYFCVCPNFVLLNDAEQRRYCGVPDLDGCVHCLEQPFMRKAFGPSFSMPAWRKAWDAFLSTASRITCPSACSRDILLKAYSPNNKRILVRPHTPLMPPGAPLRLPEPEQPMHIAVVGQLTVPKGADLVRELALLLRTGGSRARLTLVGSLAAPGVELPDNVAVSGPYDKEQLGPLLQELGVSVGLVPSVWPETFNYVTQELMQLGLPLVCFDLGAPAERIKGWEHGLIAQEPSAKAALAALCALDARRKDNSARANG
ncbi:glycosyltransferase, partial [Desulfovibrio sp. OttesenSCG-928-M14]|nr:glycosyltransferase [Desulfovibrio sp. OttesenSCG-928-M14]